MARPVKTRVLRSHLGLRLPSDLLDRLKAHCSAHGVTVTSVVEDFLSEGLADAARIDEAQKALDDQPGLFG